MGFNSSITGLLTILILLAGMVLLRWPDTNVKLVVCDVGQGDAILLISGFSQMLIDGGKDSQVIDCLSRHLPFWDRRLEIVIATHPDADHVGGLATVLQIYNVEQLLVSTTKETADFELFKQAVQIGVQNGMKITKPSLGTRLILGPLVEATVINASQEGINNFLPGLPQAETTLSAQLEAGESGVRNYNDESIALFARFGPASVLLTGDLELAGEQALLEQGLLNKTNVLKVGHHGSKTSSTQAFLTKIQPEFAIISAGKNNSYGHPHPEVVERLQTSGTVIHRTDQEGDVVLIATQQHFWFE